MTRTVTLSTILLPLAFVATGCYEPRIRSGTVRCTATRACPAGQYCIAEFCYYEGEFPDLARADRPGNGSVDLEEDLPVPPEPDLIVADLAVPDLAPPLDFTSIPDLTYVGDLACVDPTTDPWNCGQCGHSCLGGACANSKCQPIMLATASVTDLAASGGFLYWTAESGCSVFKMSVSDTTPSCLVAGGGGASIAVSATAVFWSDASGQIKRAGLDGGSPTSLASGSGNIAIDSANVYWIGGGGVFHVPQGGGSRFAYVTPSDMGPDDLRDVTSDGTYVYWSMRDAIYDNYLMRSPIGAASPSVFASTATGALLNVPFLLASFGGDIFWLGGPLQVVKIDAGGNVTTLASGLFDAGGFAVDSSGVYFTRYLSSGAVMRAALSGGSTTLLASSAQPPLAIAVDQAAVYWCDAAGSLMKLAK